MNKEKYVVKLEGKRWTECLDKAFEKKKKDLKVDGFRKGQVPKAVYIKKYGIESLYMDAIDYAVDILYADLMKDPKTITPVATPGVDIKDINEKLIKIEFTLVKAPEIKLGKYKNLGIKKEKVEITDEEVEHELSHLKEQFVDLKSLDEKTKIKEGYIAIIDFEGFLDGKAFKGGKGEDYSLEIGSHTFIPGFEEGLVGLKKGDKKDLNLTFPENYASDELKGASVVFKVEIKEIKEKVYPEFNDEFFKDLGNTGVNNLDELKNYIKEGLSAERKRTANDEFLFKCLDKINEASKYEIPEEMTEDETNRLVREFSEKLELQGLKLDDYLKFSNSTLENFKTSLKDEANKRIGYRLLIDEIVAQEKIEISNEELEEELEKSSKKYNMTKEDFINSVGNKEIFKYDLVMKKAMEIITGEKQDM